MPAYVFVKGSVKTPDLFAEYSEKASPITADFGGTLLCRGKFVKSLAEDQDHHFAAVLQFPDNDAMLGWYDSPQYQELIDLRKNAADVTITAYEGMD